MKLIFPSIAYRKFRITTNHTLIFLLLLSSSLFSNKVDAQLFQQQFTSNFATVTNGAVTDANYVSATPNSSQFTFLSTGGGGTNTMTASGGSLQIVTSGTNSLWAGVRNVNFSGPPTSLKVTFDANIAVGASGSGTPKFNFYLGSNFTNGVALEPDANVHSGFSIKYANSAYFYVKTLSGGGGETTTDRITDETNLTFTFITNNTGASLDYTAPDGTTASVANDTWDLWVGPVGVPASAVLRLNDQAATTAGQNLNQFKFGDFINSSAGRANWTLDNILMDPAGAPSPSIITSTNTLTGFIQGGATPSTSQSYTVSGSSLTAPVDVASTNSSFQISTDNSTWVSNLSLPVSGGTVTGQPKTIYVRMNDAAAGAHSGSITHMSGGAITQTVTLSGTTYAGPTIIANQTPLAFGNVVIGSPSAEKSYTISAVGLTPAAGNITVTPPSNYVVSLTSGSGYALTLNLPYTGGTLPTTTVYVSFIPTAVATYNGDIVNSGGGATPVNVPVTGAGVLQQVGDYGSSGVANGLWSDAATWKVWDGSDFTGVAPSAPLASTNIFIRPGHVVIADAAASSRLCNNLTVEGTLKSNTAVEVNTYINISGTVLTVNNGGQLGLPVEGDAADGLSLHVLNPAFFITGTGGTINLSRIRTNAANTQFVVNHDLTLNYHGSTNQGGHTTAFYPNAGDNLTVTINAGKTMRFAPWAILGSTTTGNGYGNFSMTLNVNGTLQLTDAPAPNATVVSAVNSMIYMGVIAGKTFTLNVGSTGIVNAPQIYPNGTVSGGAPGTGPLSVITVAAGGELIISKVADFRNPAQTVTGAGKFSMLSGSRLRIGSPDGISATGALGPIQTGIRQYGEIVAFAYEGTAAQVVGDGLGAIIGNITINNPLGVTTNRAHNLLQSLTLTSGIFHTGGNKISLNSAATLSRTGGHVNGLLERPVTAAGSFTFDIGDATKYTPVVINFASVVTPGTLTARTVATEHPQISSSTIDPARSVNRYYTLTNSGILFTTYDATFNFVSTDVDPTADPATFIVGDYKGGVWTYPLPGTRTATSTQSTLNTSFSDFAIGNNMAVVPLSDLLSFNAKKLVNSGSITWIISANNTVSTFELMKSEDGRNFNSLATINNANGQYNYQYNDAQLAAGTNYYRLKVTDRNGVFYYSKIVAIVNKTAGVELISMSPTLLTGSGSILSFAAAKAAPVTIIITDITGRKVAEQRHVIPEGNSSINLNLPLLSRGAYNLTISTLKEKIGVTRFVKD